MQARCCAAPATSHCGHPLARIPTTSTAWPIAAVRTGERHRQRRRTPAAATALPHQHVKSSGGDPPTAPPALSRRSALALPLALAPLTAAAAAPAAAGQLVDEATSQSVFDATSNSVVAIVQFDQKSNGVETFEALGSGVVFDGYGHVVTNYHCISRYVLDRTGADGVKVVVQRADGSSVALPASIIGAWCTVGLGLGVGGCR